MNSVFGMRWSGVLWLGVEWTTDCFSERFYSNVSFLVNADSCDGDEVSAETATLAQAHLSSESQQHVPSLSPLAAQMDYELQEALRECEDEMAALGISSHADTWTAGDPDRFFSESDDKNQTEKAEVKRILVQLHINLPNFIRVAMEMMERTQMTQQRVKRGCLASEIIF